jgi:hypothetical protein
MQETIVEVAFAEKTERILVPVPKEIRELMDPYD